MIAKRAAVSVALAAIVCAVFAPAVRNGFAGYDDEEYVTTNPHVNTGLSRQNAAWAFTHAHSSNWHPLTWLSQQLDVSWFGVTPAGPHAVNLALHAANTVLLFLWLSGSTGALWPSAFVALIFGLHPLHVESVAWIAERKDVLSGLFAILTLIAYSAYARRPGAARYALTAVLLALGLMAKPMLVTLPLVLVLVDWWPLARGVRILEKLPLAGLALLSAAATFWAQRQGGAVAGMGGLPGPLRLSNAAVSYVGYLGKFIWPTKLAAFYPFPLHGIPAWKVAACAAPLLAISLAAFVLRKQRPWLAVGWGWYAIMLLPVIGIVQVGMQSMADRYMYLPMIGLLMAIAWEGARLDRRAAGAAGVVLAAACAIVSWRQIPVWKDGLTLFTHALAVTQDNFVAHDNLGVELDRRGRAGEAMAHYRETLRIKPGDRIGENNLAMACFARGERLFQENRHPEAFASLEEGLRYRPGNATVHTYLGLIFLERQQIGPAEARFRAALAMDPAFVRAHVGLGVAMAHAGRDEEARRSFAEAVRLDPSNVEARFDLALVLAALGRRAEAVAQLDEILKTHPDYAPARDAKRALGGG